MKKAVEDWHTAAQKQDVITDQIDKAQKLSDIMVGAFENPQAEMKKLFTDLLKQLLMAIAKATILKGLLGNSGGFNLGSVISNTLFGGGKATGGSVSGSNYYLVGEKGPELFAPGRSGTIIPNKNAFGGSGGGVSFGDFNVTVQGSTDSSTVQSMNYQMAEYRKNIIREVRKEMARSK
jgi:hypothetical protein